MKYIITENQQKRMLKHISEILNDEFGKTNVICGITVRDVDEEEYDYEIEKGLKYDIFVHINDKFVRTAGIYGFKLAVTKKIKTILSDWLGIEENEYYISTLVRDC